MIGAILGDIIGSPYEFDRCKGISLADSLVIGRI